MYKIRRDGVGVKISKDDNDFGAYIADVKDFAYDMLKEIVKLANERLKEKEAKDD